MGNCVTINTNNRGVVAPMNSDGGGGGGGGTTISNNIGGEEEEEASCLESLGCMLCG
jgi:hypothetical protein